MGSSVFAARSFADGVRPDWRRQGVVASGERSSSWSAWNPCARPRMRAGESGVGCRNFVACQPRGRASGASRCAARVALASSHPEPSPTTRTRCRARANTSSGWSPSVIQRWTASKVTEPAGSSRQQRARGQRDRGAAAVPVCPKAGGSRGAHDRGVAALRSRACQGHRRRSRHAAPSTTAMRARGGARGPRGGRARRASRDRSERESP